MFTLHTILLAIGKNDVKQKNGAYIPVLRAK